MIQKALVSGNPYNKMTIEGYGFDMFDDDFEPYIRYRGVDSMLGTKVSDTHIEAVFLDGVPLSLHSLSSDLPSLQFRSSSETLVAKVEENFIIEWPETDSALTHDAQ